MLHGRPLLDTCIDPVASCFFPFLLSSPTSLLCSSVTFWMAACFSWLPLRNVSRHWINGSHLLWFQTNFKPIKNLSHLSCGVPAPAWSPEAQMYLGKGSKVPKNLPVCGLSWSWLSPLLQGTVLQVLWLHKAAYSPWPDPGMKKGPGAPHVPASIVKNPLPKAAFFWGALGVDGIQTTHFRFLSVTSCRYFWARDL